MKYLSPCVFALLLGASVPSFAMTVTVNQLSCSGLGLTSGYTTIDLVDSKTVKMTSIKYGVVASDENVKITNAQVLANGQVHLDLHTPKYDMNFALVLSAPDGSADFITGGGTDTLNCKSNIHATP